MEVRALMKVLIGVDPHKASLAVAAVDEASGELLGRANFPQDRSGLRRLERWAKRFPERRWAVENAGGLGRHLAVRLAGSGESVVDVPPKLSARVRVLSSFAGNRHLNYALHMIAVCQARSEVRGGAYYRKKIAEGKSSKEALRCLKRRISDAVFRSLVADSQAPSSSAA
jgi:hypothetical protein